MTFREIKTISFGLLSLFLTTQASALELDRTETSARYVSSAEAARAYIELSFSAQIQSLATSGEDLVVDWRQAGGIDPTPFSVLVPAGCFVRGAGDLLVRNHRRCGVSAQLLTPSGDLIDLPLYAFGATLSERRGFARLVINTAVGVDSELGDLSSVILSSLGSARQTIILGEDSGSLLPNDISVLGFNPQPEPPPKELLLP